MFRIFLTSNRSTVFLPQNFFFELPLISDVRFVHSLTPQQFLALLRDKRVILPKGRCVCFPVVSTYGYLLLDGTHSHAGSHRDFIDSRLKFRIWRASANVSCNDTRLHTLTLIKFCGREFSNKRAILRGCDRRKHQAWNSTLLAWRWMVCQSQVANVLGFRCSGKVIFGGGHAWRGCSFPCSFSGRHFVKICIK